MTESIIHSAEWRIIGNWNRQQVKEWQDELADLSCPADRAQQLRGMIHAVTLQNDHFDPQRKPPIKEVNYG